jgi:hypothetical protein
MSGQYQERKEYFKQYREKNKERLQQKRHDYYEENKDRIKEYAKQWKQDNPSMLWLYGVGHRTATCVLELGAR